MGDERYRTEHIRDGADAGTVTADQGGPAHPAISESELAERYWERIRVFAARRLRDPASAQDVAQETLRRVVDALRAGRVQNLDALPGFVFQTARHICLQRDRSAMRESRALTRWGRPETTTEPDALLALITEERCAAVRQALDALDNDDRALLRVFYFESLETAVIAERMGVSAGALRVRKHRALVRLSELLNSRDQ